jgi:hypothetical protein
MFGNQMLHHRLGYEAVFLFRVKVRWRKKIDIHGAYHVTHEIDCTCECQRFAVFVRISLEWCSEDTHMPCTCTRGRRLRERSASNKYVTAQKVIVPAKLC